MSTANWHLSTESPGGMGTHPMRNKAVAILTQMQAGRPAFIQKDGGEMLIAIVLDRPLADAKALVDDPAAFTREMTKILLEKQSHALIAQMIKPAGSSDPPPQTAQPVAPAAMNTPAPGRPCSSSNLKRLTWGAHGCHTRRVTTVQHRCCHMGTHG